LRVKNNLDALKVYCYYWSTCFAFSKAISFAGANCGF